MKKTSVNSFESKSIWGLCQITAFLLIYQHRDSFEAYVLSDAPEAPSQSLTAGHLTKATRNSLNANARRVAENEKINEQEAGNIGGVISLSHFHAKWGIFARVVGTLTTIALWHYVSKVSVVSDWGSLSKHQHKHSLGHQTTGSTHIL